MKIDIDKLTEAELIDLNHRIVERLRFLHQLRSHVEMLEYRIGERVEFQPDGQTLQTGVITRYNKKTVTVITDAGQRWNVAPQFLRRASSADRRPRRSPAAREMTRRSAPPACLRRTGSRPPGLPAAGKAPAR